MMKTPKMLILLASITILFSCSKSNNDPNSDTDDGSNPPAGGVQLISKIENDAPYLPWDYGATFYYTNSRLQFLDLAICSGNVYYFEYNANGKVSKHYTFVDNDFNINTVDIEQIINDNISIDYIYENDKLVRFDILGFPNQYFRYFPNGLLKEIEKPGTDKIVINYQGTQVSEITYFWLPDGGISIYTFEYDDKINPIYEEFNHFGIMDLQLCRALEDVTMFEHFPIFMNNVTKVYKDDILEYSAIYQYLDNDYPERIITHDIDNNTQRSEFFTY